MGQQHGGNNGFNLGSEWSDLVGIWWDEVNDKLGMDEPAKDMLIYIKLSSLKIYCRLRGGKPVSRNAFIIAHAMWDGNAGNILPGVFDDNESQLAAINEAFDTDFTDIDDFIKDYHPLTMR